MNMTDIAANIVAARRTGNQTHIEWPDPAPTLDDAMDIQRMAFEQFGSPSIGWKVGATNEGAQKNFGLTEPFYGPIAEAGLLQSGDKLEKTSCIGAMEPEYAFKMARDFPGDGEAIDVESASSAVEAVHIAIEVIGRCIASEAYQNGIGVTMDFGGNAAFVLGPRVQNWRDQDLVGTPVTAMVDGEITETGNGEPVLGGPINSLVWLAHRLAAGGMVLKAGDWVSTGTCTPPVPAKTGSALSARFGDFGEVVVHIV